MSKFFARFLYGLVFAIPLMLVTFFIAQAANRPQQTTPDPSLNCKDCHAAFYQTWENGAHGRATTDPAFNQEWEARGKPADCLKCHVTGYDPATNTWSANGITCVACHYPITANHPLAPMSTNSSAKACGECHTETYFEYQVSVHREKGLDCVGCHDPHATGLKTTDAGALCSTCHRSRASNFAHTQHSAQGLTCASCHLTHLDKSGIEGQAKVDHSFFVSLSSCNSCHSYQMHDPIEVHSDNPTPEPADAMASVEKVNVSREPVPVSPIGFSTLSGLIGVAVGIILAPWLDRRRRSLLESKHQDSEEQE